MNLASKMGFAGTVVPLRVSGLGFYEKVTTGIFARGMPAGLPLKYRLRSAWYELTLRVRIAFVGFLRALYDGEGVGVIGRVHATRFNCGCGQDAESRERHKSLGIPCPAATFDHFGMVATRVVTDAGVTFLRDDWNANAQDFTTYNFHGCGTGTTAEATTDTALVTESTTALNPDSTRATGTRSTPASNQFRSVGTLTFDADTAVTEHGLFSQSATGGGSLWDRSKFAAINVVGANGDSIQFTYTGTLSSGG